MEFKSITYKKMPGIIARVNRVTGDLYINPESYQQLTPDHRDFVLLHESGHLTLQSADEFTANNYAVSKFMKMGELTDQAFKRKVEVMADLLENESTATDSTFSPFSNMGDPVSSISGVVGSVFGILPALGIGSKARKEEAQLAAEITASQQAAKDKTNIILLSVGGFFVADNANSNNKAEEMKSFAQNKKPINPYSNFLGIGEGRRRAAVEEAKRLTAAQEAELRIATADVDALAAQQLFDIKSLEISGQTRLYVILGSSVIAIMIALYFIIKK